MNGKTILITGASGFTGRHFISLAKQAGYRCVALRHHEHESVSGADECFTANLLNLPSLQTAVAQAKPDKLLHLAAISFVAHENTAEIYQTNLIGTLNLLNAVSAQASSIEKIVIASSANIYGNARDLPITEETLPQPVNHYGVSKYSMEQVVALFAELPAIIVRPFNYTGVGQSPNFLVPKIVNAFQRSEKSIELGNLDVSRDFSDVRDVVRAYLGLLESGTIHTTYNICSGKATALQSIVSTLNRLSGYEIDVHVNPAFVRSDEIKTLYGSPQRLEEAIGNYREHSLRDTLDWMLNGSGPAKCV
ncbi:MAG: nucleoside-diphosphate-sugar epimerase [Alcanivorax sp.]|jgi:nucleoside-diphosphate-sugar epimerase